MVVVGRVWQLYQLPVNNSQDLVQVHLLLKIQRMKIRHLLGLVPVPVLNQSLRKVVTTLQPCELLLCFHHSLFLSSPHIIMIQSQSS